MHMVLCGFLRHFVDSCDLPIFFKVASLGQACGRIIGVGDMVESAVPDHGITQENGAVEWNYQNVL